MNLMAASNQWATRPADQRFWDLDELYQAVREIRAHSVIGHCAESDLRVETDGDSIRLVGKTGQPAALSHWGFGQLATRAQAPANYLRTLPATLAAQNINHGLKMHARPDHKNRLLVYRNGGFLVRSVATEKFTPVWNVNIAERLRRLGGDWRPPPAYPAGEHTPEDRIRIATAEDARYSLTVREGERIGPAGLYASAEDMFVFLVSPNHVVRDGSEGGLMRGVIVQNAEVCGKLTFKVYTFYLRGVCGNHIIWNATGLTEIKVKHVGTAPDRAFSRLAVTVRRYAEGSATEEEAKIQAAQTREIGATKAEVLDALFGRKVLTRRAADEAYTLAEMHADTDGNPRSYWGMANGVTRLSQTIQQADARTELDRASGKILNMAF